MLFSNIISKAGRRGGFSLGEVLVATALFMTAVVGVGGMLVAGTAGVSRSAQANKAEKLAMQKIEEVKNLPFYTPWGESGQDTDIDDFYYNVGGTYPNDQQFAHPKEENPVTGDVGYRRTTAVQYVYAGASKLEYAEMDPTWVPNTPSPPTTFDKPKGGPAGGGPYEYLHGIMIEVRVYYMINGVEKSVVQHALAGDLITPGGEENLNPILVVEKIVPNVGYLGDSSVDCTISVTAPELAVGDEVEVSLWRNGVPDDQNIVATNVVVVSNTTITCRFNLLSPLPDPDTYNLSVYWVTRGFKDDRLRGCFDVLVNPPTMTSVYTTGEPASPAWGYQGQNARTIWIVGTNLAACNASLTKTGQSGIAGSGYNYNAGGTLAWANFNLTTAVTGNWNMEVSNGAGGVSINNCFEQNPQVTISSINQGGSYYSWGYRDLPGSRRVQVNGTYLYGLNSAPGTSDLTRAGLPDCDGTFVSGASGNGISRANCTSAVIDYSLSGTPAQRPNNTKWKVYVNNGGNRNASMDGVWDGVGPDYAFQMNPAPQVTGFSGLGSVWTGTRGGNQTSGIGVTGKYLQSGANVYVYRDNGDTTLTDVVLGSVNPAADGTSIAGMTMRTHVNPMTSSFMIWGGGAQNDNTKIGGTYYVYYWGPDDQQVQAPGSFTVNHARYTMTVSRKQTWGTVSCDNSNPWQDESVTLSASPSSGSIFRYWQYPVGTDHTSANPWNFEATESRSIRGRFRKYLFNGGQTVSWVRGYYDARANYSIGSELYCNGYYHWRYGSGEVAVVTNSTHSFAGADRLYINWHQTQLWGDSYFIYDNDKNGNKGNYYGRIFEESDYGWRTQSLDVTGHQGSYYVRMHSRNDGVWDSKVYANQVYLE